MKKFILLALGGITALLCGSRPTEAVREANLTTEISRLSERAMALYSHGRLEEAKAEFAAMRVTLTQTVGPRDVATLATRNNYGAVLFAMGDLAQAEVEHRRTMTLRDKELGRLNLDAIASRHNLAVTLMHAGKYEEALVNERCVEVARRHLLGKNNAKTRQAQRTRMLIEDAMKGSRPGNGPSGIGNSGILPA